MGVVCMPRRLQATVLQRTVAGEEELQALLAQYRRRQDEGAAGEAAVAPADARRLAQALVQVGWVVQRGYPAFEELQLWAHGFIATVPQLYACLTAGSLACCGCLPQKMLGNARQSTILWLLEALDPRQVGRRRLWWALAPRAEGLSRGLVPSPPITHPETHPSSYPTLAIAMHAGAHHARQGGQGAGCGGGGGPCGAGPGRRAKGSGPRPAGVSCFSLGLQCQQGAGRAGRTVWATLQGRAVVASCRVQAIGVGCFIA